MSTPAKTIESIKLVKTYTDPEMVAEIIVNGHVIASCDSETWGPDAYEVLESVAKGLSKMSRVPVEEVEITKEPTVDDSDIGDTL